MLPSLSSRITALGTLMVFGLLSLAVALVAASLQTRESFHQVTHAAVVLETTRDGLSELRDAESSQRGYVITHDALHTKAFEDHVLAARRDIARAVALTRSDPAQHDRLRAIQVLADQRLAAMREPLDLVKIGDFAGAELMISGGRGRDLAATITEKADAFLQQERTSQAIWIDLVERHLSWITLLVLAGIPMLMLLSALVSMLIMRGIKRPLDVIKQAMANLGAGDSQARITHTMGSREFVDLARRYNAMADHLETAVTEQVDSEHRLQAANEELRRNGEILRGRTDLIELLGGMAHRMQAARTGAELAQIIRVFVPQVLPGTAGMLYVHNNSRNQLVPCASWGGAVMDGQSFAPDACWALRRGQSHFVTQPDSDIVCGHVADDEAVYHCEPLLAAGEVIGILHLQGSLANDSRFQLTVLAENIASALVNQRLQRDLREQTIRDPLTSLYNRRYMEEALSVEIGHAMRANAPLSVVMCDVDHFKRFNDEFGHEAGDLVLQAVAAELRNRFRNGDVVCRYGGEEFTVIAPGTTAATLIARVEAARQAISELDVRQGGRRLCATSMSFGIASWERDMGGDGSSLIQAADAALYQAKREGRNRAVIDLRAVA